MLLRSCRKWIKKSDIARRHGNLRSPLRHVVDRGLWNLSRFGSHHMTSAKISPMQVLSQGDLCRYYRAGSGCAVHVRPVILISGHWTKRTLVGAHGLGGKTSGKSFPSEGFSKRPDEIEKNKPEPELRKWFRGSVWSKISLKVGWRAIFSSLLTCRFLEEKCRDTLAHFLSSSSGNLLYLSSCFSAKFSMSFLDFWYCFTALFPVNSSTAFSPLSHPTTKQKEARTISVEANIAWKKEYFIVWDFLLFQKIYSIAPFYSLCGSRRMIIMEIGGVDFTISKYDDVRPKALSEKWSHRKILQKFPLLGN